MQCLDAPEQAIQTFEKIHGLRVTVHDLSGSLFAGISRDRYRHTHPLCHCVRANRSEASCVALEIFQVRSQAQTFTEGRYHVCHAGFVEWVIPVFHGPDLEWMVFAGIRRPSPKLNAGFYQARTKWQRRPWNAKTPMPPEVNDEEAGHVLEHLRQLTARLYSLVHKKEWSLLPAARKPGAKVANLPLERRRIIRNFIDSCHIYNVRVKELASQLSVSEGRATHLVRECCGESFREMLVGARIKTAKDLLRFTSLPILEVALSSGFTEVSHFTRIFRRREGLSPGRYRRRMLKK